MFKKNTTATAAATATNKNTPFVQKDMSGSLFENENATGKAPTMQGSMTVFGEKFRIKAWENESQSGKAYLGFVIQTEDEFQEQLAEYKAQQNGNGKPPFPPKSRRQEEAEDTPVARKSPAAQTETDADEDDLDEEEITPPKRESAKTKK